MKLKIEKVDGMREKICFRALGSVAIEGKEAKYNKSGNIVDLPIVILESERSGSRLSHQMHIDEAKELLSKLQKVISTIEDI